MSERRVTVRARRAFTLVEALVAAALLAGALAAIYQFLSMGTRASRKLDFHLEVLQAAWLVRSRLADDLASQMPISPDQAVAATGAALSLLRVESGAAGGVAGTCLDERLRPAATTVQWTFDPRSRRLLRNGASVTPVPIRDVTFTYVPRDPAAQGETLESKLTFVEPGPKGRTETLRLRFTCPLNTLARAYDDFLVDVP